MGEESQGPITELLKGWRGGDDAALDKLIPLVYDDLRRIAARQLRRERPNHTLQPTALVHEVFLKLIDQNRIQWQNRAQFFGVAAQLIRRILVDYLRAQHAEKRGGAVVTIALDEAVAEAGRPDLDLIRLDEALNSLAARDEQQSQVVVIRFFGGLSIDETAEVLGVSASTVKRDWLAAKAWLYREVSRSGSS
jgi:RNA polymerase sigma factor (TIGR02999 family)